MAAQFQAQTGESLHDFIETADWHGERDKQQALNMISPERDRAAEGLAQMTPQARKELDTKANGWAQRVLAVTRPDDTGSDTAAADIFRVLGPRSPEEIEAVRAAIRRNTNGQHSAYEELDRSLSGGTEDEAVAGLSGNPVQATWAGLKNVDSNPERTKELLRGVGDFTAAQKAEFQMQKAVFGTGWILDQVPAGADREEIRHLLDDDKVATDGAHLANLLRPPEEGATYRPSIHGLDKDEQTNKVRSGTRTRQRAPRVREQVAGRTRRGARGLGQAGRRDGAKILGRDDRQPVW